MSVNLLFYLAYNSRVVFFTCQDVLECQLNVAGVECGGLNEGEVVVAYSYTQLALPTTQTVTMS